MGGDTKRIAVNVGGDYVSGVNAVVVGVVRAASRLGWEVVGIRDGFDGLLFPERYPDGAITPIGLDQFADSSGIAGDLLGNATRTNPFLVQHLNADNQVEEVDRSDDLIAAAAAHDIDAVISIVDHRALSVLLRLARKGLRSICIPKSVQNDVPETAMSFGFNTALHYTVDMLDRVRAAAKSAGRLAVVEVLGERAGWLALQSAMAVVADAVLIPEIPYDLNLVAAKLNVRPIARRGSGLVVVAEGAAPRAGAHSDEIPDPTEHSLRAALAPLASGPQSAHVIRRSGQAAEQVALALQRLTDLRTYPLVLDELVRAGLPTATDRQLGLACGAAAVSAVEKNITEAMVVFQPPSLHLTPLAEVINKVRRVPLDGAMVQTARALNISLGDEVTL